jgi:hypothetical protein
LVEESSGKVVAGTKRGPNMKEDFCLDWNRVARWFIFKSKIPIWVNFGVP